MSLFTASGIRSAVSSRATTTIITKDLHIFSIHNYDNMRAHSYLIGTSVWLKAIARIICKIYGYPKWEGARVVGSVTQSRYNGYTVETTYVLFLMTCDVLYSFHAVVSIILHVIVLARLVAVISMLVTSITLCRSCHLLQQLLDYVSLYQRQYFTIIKQGQTCHNTLKGARLHWFQKVHPQSMTSD